MSMAALSILAQALSSMVPETDPAMKTMVSIAHSIANSVLSHDPGKQPGDPNHLNPGAEHSVTGAIVTVAGTTLTAVQSSGQVVLGSHTLKVGQSATISSVVVSAGSTDIVVGSKTAVLTALPIGPKYAAIPFSPIASASGDDASDAVTMVSAGSLTMAMSALDSDAVVVDGTTLSVGGPMATISGYVISDAANGLVWLSLEAADSTETSLPAVVTGTSHGSITVDGLPGAKSRTMASEASSTSTSGAMSRRVARYWDVFPVMALLMIGSMLVLG
jgi:hypothetical protein